MNRLPLHRVDEIIRCFDAGLGVRATARITGHAPRTVARYRRLWWSGTPQRATTLVCRLPARTGEMLQRMAVAQGQAPSTMVSRIVEVVIDDGLGPLVLA